MSPIILHINYFQCGDPARQKEYDFCFSRNQFSGYFSQIINYNGRMTYEDFFTETRYHPEAIHVLANLDIYFNETILLAQEIKEDEAYALTRWELYDLTPVPFEEYHNGVKAMHSQDVWIIRGGAKPVFGGFNMGVAGCDNRIAFELAQYYTVKNPSDKIQCIHKHQNDERNYSIPGKVDPPYLWVEVGGGAITPSMARFRRRR